MRESEGWGFWEAGWLQGTQREQNQALALTELRILMGLAVCLCWKKREGEMERDKKRERYKQTSILNR